MTLKRYISTRYWRIRGYFFPKCEGGNPSDKDGGICETEGCQHCCPHDEYDHYICLDCGHERCPGDDIDWMMDRMEDR